ncbi:MAG: MFS transporter [Negativicutes bacterium]|nr:MFS transporter [Negativicutes bacterium]
MSTPSHRSKDNSLALLWALGIAGFLVNADNRAVAPILPAIAGDLAIRESTAGLLVSAYSLPYGLFQLVYGPIADRIGKTRVTLIALALFSLGTVACGFADSFAWLLALRFITGVFAAGIIPVSLAQIGDSFPLAKRQSAISFFMAFCTSGQALGIVIGALLAQFYTWKTLFILVGLAGFPALLLLRRQPHDTAQATAATLPLLDGYKTVFASQRSRIVYLAVWLEGAIFYGGFTYLGVYANIYLGLDYYLVGLFTALFSAAAFVGTRFIPAILGRVGQHRMPTLGVSMMAAAFALIWLVANWGALMVGFILLGIGFIIIHSTLQTYATELLPEARGTAMSLFAFFLFFGNGIGPAFFGWVYDYGGVKIMLATTTLCLTIFALGCRLAFRQFAAPTPGTTPRES